LAQPDGLYPSFIWESLPTGVAGLAIFGAIVSAIWFPIAFLLGRRYESARGAR